MIKLIALDMDGTLLNKQHAISPRNQQAIHAAKQAGIRVVLASGRPRQGLQPHLEHLQLTTDEEFVISYNGSLVERVESSEVLYETMLTGKDVKKVFEMSKQLGVYIHAFSVKQGLITHQNNPYTDIEAEINKITSSEFDFNRINESDRFIKVMMVAEAQQLTEAITKIPASLKANYTVVRSAPIFVEVLHPDCSKGIAVEKLCELLDITAAEVMCVGDAENDHAMLAFAGVAVAMENADEETKALADFITTSNNDDGVAVAIEKFAL